jgi:hypothetical protein
MFRDWILSPYSGGTQLKELVILRNVIILSKGKVDTVQNYDSYINTRLSQTYRSH